MSDEINLEIVEQLKNSAKLRGPIEKVVLSADGKLVDGHQRKAADPDWPEEVNPNLKTEEDCVLFEIDKNWNRTNKTEGWKQSRIERLARLGNSVEDVMRKTGFKEWKVYHYYPDDLKDQVKAAAGKVGGPAASVVRVTTQEELREAEAKARGAVCECNNCHMGYSMEELKYIDSKPYCPRCAPRAHIAYEREKKRLEREAEAKEKPVTPGSLDGPETKEGRMHPQKSAFEERVVNRLRKLLGEGLGFGVITDREFCVQSTVPDAYISELDALIYLDGLAVHMGKKADKDERLRETLKRHHKELNIQGFPYKADTKQEEDRVLKELETWVNGLTAELQKWKTKENVSLPSASDDKEEP